MPATGRGKAAPATAGPAMGLNDKVKPNRGDLILFFGLTSLLCCWPLGIAAWIMGNSDLRGIRNGVISSDGLGTVRVGRVLGIVGTVLFVVSVSAAIVAAVAIPSKIPDLKLSVKDRLEQWLKRSVDDFKSVPLPKDKLSFVGEWMGEQGTVLRIYPTGRGDYKGSTAPGRTSSLSGGRVRIDGDKLSVGLLGIERTFHVDKPPVQQHGTWTMTLNGEVFTKKGVLETPPGPRELSPEQPTKEYEVRHQEGLIGLHGTASIIATGIRRAS